jgi:hypothetical protein
MSLSVTEYLIDKLLNGIGAKTLIESETQVDCNVRAFYDSGILQFCTPDDVMIEYGTDSRIDTILSVINDNDWPSTHPLPDELDGYEGSLNDLYSKVTAVTGDD